MLGQEGGDGGQAVGLGPPDVHLPVAVAIGGVGQVARRHHLRLAQRPAPARPDLAAGTQALLQDVQGRHDLAGEPVHRGRHEGLGRQHLEGIVGDGDTAEGALAAPDRDEDMGRNAEPLLDPGQVGGVARHQLAPDRAGPRHVAALEVTAGRAELRLPLRLRRVAGPDDAGQVPFEGHIAQRALEGVAADPFPGGAGPDHLLQPAAELRLHLPTILGRRGQGQQGKTDGEQTGSHRGTSCRET